MNKNYESDSSFTRFYLWESQPTTQKFYKQNNEPVFTHLTLFRMGLFGKKKGIIRDENGSITEINGAKVSYLDKTELYIYNQATQSLSLTLRPDQVVMVLIALASFADRGKTVQSIAGQTITTYTSAAHRIADILWEEWLEEIIQELNLRDEESNIMILPKITTGLLALRSEDIFAYYHLASRRFSKKEFQTMDIDGLNTPSEVDILLAALMNLEGKHYNKIAPLRKEIEAALVTEQLLYPDFNELERIDSMIQNVLKIFEKIHNWPVYGDLYYNKTTNGVHWKAFLEPLPSHADDTIALPWQMKNKQNAIESKDYQMIRRELGFIGISSVTFSDKLPPLTAEEYELLGSTSHSVAEEHIYAEAGWVRLSRHLLVK